MRRLVLLILCGSLATSAVHAVSVRRWNASTEQEFLLGTFDGTSIDLQGRIGLAPQLTHLWGPESGILWDLASGPQGRVFAAISGPGQVLAIDADGTSHVWYDADGESLITALVADGHGGVYAGLSPDGRILHLKRAGEATVVVETGATFVWALARDAQGTVWIGTGIPGTVQSYSDKSGHETVYTSGADPVRALAVAGTTVFAGTGGQGRVIRLSTSSRPFVMFDAPETEIVALDHGPDGTVWALAATGGRRVAAAGSPGQPPSGSYVRVTAEAPPDDDEQEETQADPRERTRRQAPFRANMGARLYRLDSSGTESVWSNDKVIPFDLAVFDDATLLIATGEQGRVWRLDRQGRTAQLIRVASNHASALARDSRGAVWVGGTSDARIERLEGDLRSEGRYLSFPIDAGTQARWGRVEYEAKLPAGSELLVEARAGNTTEPNESWSAWSPLRADGSVDLDKVPPSRLLQLRITLRTAGDTAPTVSALRLSFLPRNRPPQIASLRVEPVGAVIVPGTAQASARLGPWVADDPVTRQTFARKQRGPVQRPVRRAYEAGIRSFTWSATDPDRDRLVYRLDLRREGESFWYPIAAELTSGYYSWDARATPDGRYRVRLSASDEIDNVAGTERTRTEISDLFTVDHSRPTIGDWSIRGGAIEFSALDPGGTVAAVEIAMDDGAWRPLRPEDGVADSELERYRFQVGERSPMPTSVRVRVIDSAGNLGGEMRQLEAP